jgi:hypothetical protein
MDSEFLPDAVQRLQFQMKLVGEALDHREHPIASLVISLNWSEQDLEAAHDIFERYDHLLEENKSPQWGQFEHELRDRFSISYQSVKWIILAFYHNGQWTSVCQEYAKAYSCAEFHEILER